MSAQKEYNSQNWHNLEVSFALDSKALTSLKNIWFLKPPSDLEDSIGEKKNEFILKNLVNSLSLTSYYNI